MDREKVIKGLVNAIQIENRNGKALVYLRVSDAKDILTMLKEYDTQVQYRDDHIAEYEKEIKRLNKLAKEQEAEIRQLRLALDIAKGTCNGIVVECR